MKFKRMLTIGLCALLGCSVLAGCAGGGGNEGGGNGGGGSKDPLIPSNTVTEREEHKVSNGLHKISVTETQKPYITNGTTEYKYVAPTMNEKRTREAVSLVVSHTREATGATLTAAGDVTWSESEKLIVICNDTLFQAAGLTLPEDDIGQTGYYITTKGNSVFIAAKGPQGVLNGALKFLHYTVGYEMYAHDTVAYNGKTSINLPDFNVVEKPDFEFFLTSNAMSSVGLTGMNFMNTPDVFIPVGGDMWHNSFKYMHPNDYPDHPEWFAINKAQLCYTARGDEDELNAMLDEFMKKMIAAVEASSADNITITIQDTMQMCECDACRAERVKYGTDAAAVVKFCNKASARLDEYLAAKAEAEGTEPRVVNVLFFAYFKTTQPPVKKENGKYVPIDEDVVCGEHVGVYIAPISASYNKSFYADENSTTAEVIKGWGALSDKLYMWLYETNYSHYLYPLNSYDTMGETYRFCKENNAIFMFPEGQYNQGNVTAFAKLKEYFNSKAMWNVNTDFSEIRDNFFANYFREASEPMMKYFEELQLHLNYLEATYPELNGGIYVNMEQARFWPKRLLDRWLGYIDEGYAAIEKYRDTDPELYEVLAKHLKIETIFPRFAQIRLNDGYYSDAELSELRNSFKDDCRELSITMISEQGSLESIFSTWG